MSVHLIFTKSCIPILLLNNKNDFLQLFCLLQWKYRLSNICEETQWDSCAFSKNVSLSLKNYSFQWQEISETNSDNEISDIGHTDCTESHEKFTFYFVKQKIPAWNIHCFEVDVLISWYLTRSHDINIRIRIFFFTWVLEPW